MVSLCYLFLYLFICEISSVTSKCEKSFITVCNNLSDVRVNKTKNVWSELLVEYPKYEEQPPSYSLTQEYLPRDLSNLQWLIINCQLNEIHKSAFTYTKKLEYLILYNNQLKTIGTLTFVRLTKLLKLDLTNNAIKSIRTKSFFRNKIEFIDLSHNLLEEIKSRTFIGCELTKLTVKHNKLMRIEDGSLPINVKVLILDFNDFRFIPDDTKNLNQLEEFSMSNNQLSGIDYRELNGLNALRKLDLSGNRIKTLNNAFDNLKNLETLNLANNDLGKFIFTPGFMKNLDSKIFYLFLSHNRLRDLLLPTALLNYNIVLSLIGNPWNCLCLQSMEAVFTSGKISRTECDEKILKLGKNPICVISNTGQCEDDLISDLDYELFKNLSRNANCNVQEERIAKEH